jgi:scyllo-inositol 2-dehydrogenase (NADP+)
MADSIRWGILGTGMIAHKFAEGLRDVAGAKLIAVGSRSQDSANRFAREYLVPHAFGSYEDLALCENVDVIYIATPHNLHCENTLLCLDHGKHVLCEKPFAVNRGEVEQMIERARAKNLFLMEALWSRFLPHIIKAKELIGQGAIGEVKLLKADFGINSPYDDRHRHYNRDLIGGSLLDIGIYPLFLAQFLLGKPSQVRSVAGLGPTLVDHTCSMSLHYQNDLVAHLVSSVVAQTEVIAEIYGTEGKIIFDRWWFTPVPIRLVDAAGTSHDVPVEMHGNGYNYEADEVGLCLREGKKQSDFWNWNDSLELIDLMDGIRKECGIYYPGHDL